MLILTGFAGGFAHESASNAGNCSIYSVNNLFPSNTQAKTNVFAWTVKLEGDPSGNGLSHFNLVNTNQSKTCASDVASLIKQAWYSTDANPGPVGGPKWSTTSVVIGDGSTDDCLPNGTADRPYVIKFSVTAPFIHYALEFKSKYPVSTGVAVPKYGRNCCSTPIQFPNFCDPSPVCVDPVFTVNKTDLTCFGSANGSISVTGVTGGVSPYTYSLNGGAYSENSTFSGLSAGTYNVKVKESEGGCTTEQQVVLIQPTALVASNDKVDVKCFGESTGSVDASVSGGTAPYTYSWSNGSTNQDLSGLAAGTYTLTVTDANGCTTTTQALVGQPVAALVASNDKVDVKCFGESTGSVDASVSGGTAPYTYSWSNGSTNQDLSGLAAGTYTLTVTDANGCKTTTQAVVGQPTALSAGATKVDAKCFNGTDGSVDLSVSGGTSPYTYLWSNNATTQDLSGVAAGVYNVTVTDANGCTTTANAIVGQPSEPVAASVTETKGTECAGTKTGSITLSVSGGTAPYQYKLNGGSLTNLPANGIIASLQAGNYTVYVQDANGCNVTIQGNVTVAEGPVCYPYYTYSQGYYGQSNGVACIRGVGGQQTAAFVGRALGVQGMTLGNMSTKYFVVPNTPTAIASLIKIMPGGGSPNILTGSATLPTVASTLLKNGKINNVLLGQTVAMWLNVNIPGNELGTLDLKGLKCKNTIVTKEPSSASSCNLPHAGTTELSTAFPQSVVNALISRAKIKGGTTVKDLVDLASEALGNGVSKINYGVSLSDINAALDAIVNAFHGGKYFARFAGEIPGCVIPAPATTNINVASPIENATAVKVETSNAGVSVMAFPNPYIDQVTFNVTVKNAGKGSLVIYNMLGQKVTNLFEGNMQANSTQTIRYNVPFDQRKNLVYVFRQNDTISTGKLVSGK